MPRVRQAEQLGGLERSLLNLAVANAGSQGYAAAIVVALPILGESDLGRLDNDLGISAEIRAGLKIHGLEALGFRQHQAVPRGRRLGLGDRSYHKGACERECDKLAFHGSPPPSTCIAVSSGKGRKSISVSL